MSKYRRLVEEFLLRYERPQVDDLVVGFSGIDPSKRVNAGDLNHEELDGLLGGSAEEGHYHLTLNEWDNVIWLLENPCYDGGYASTTAEEYGETERYWMNGGDA